MSNEETCTNNTVNGSAVKRFRSVKEYRDKKKLQKLNGSGVSERRETLSVSSGSFSLNQNENDAKDAFVKVLKDTVAGLCYAHLGEVDAVIDSSTEFVPEWRIVCRIVSQTLLDKEARMPSNVRFNLSDPKMYEATIRRIRGYTNEYLNRKYPK